MNKYSPLNPAAFFMIQRRQRILRKIFASAFPGGVENVSLLEIGCGNGQWLKEFQAFGFSESDLAGIELSAERAEAALKRVTNADIRQGSAAELPWDDNSFDVVFQSTVFSSIHDEEVRSKAATEMKRVCKKNGFILWYDFIYDSPSNPNVRKMPRSEVKKLFAPWDCEFQSVTLVPQLTRLIAPVSWTAAELCETFLPFLRTHIIARITNKD